MCALLVGLPDVNVLAVQDDDPAEPLRVHVETTAGTVGCSICGTRARVKDRRPVALVDLAAFGRPAVLVWHKRRWCCVEADCVTGTWTEQAPAIAAPRAKVTDRAGQSGPCSGDDELHVDRLGRDERGATLGRSSGSVTSLRTGSQRHVMRALLLELWIPTRCVKS